jgi:hypothetical protein
VSEIFRAFANDVDVVNIQGDDLSVSNGIAHVVISGTLDIGKDGVGLKAALALQAAVNSIVNELQATTNLPAHIKEEPSAPRGYVENPFS